MTMLREVESPRGVGVADTERSLRSELGNLLIVDPTDQTQVFSGGSALRALVGRVVSSGWGNRIAASFTAEQRGQFRALNDAYEVAVDNSFMDDVLVGAITDPDQYPSQPFYDRLSSMEGQALGANIREPILHIGSGWPGTAIGIYRQFGTPVVCVEKDPEVARKSEKALDKLGLLGKDKLRVIAEDGTEVNPHGFKAIIISGMVPNEDKQKIRKNLRDFACAGITTLLMQRTPVDSTRELFYQVLDESAYIEFLVDTAQFMQPEDPLWSFACRMRFPEGARGDRRARLANARLKPVEGVTPWMGSPNY